MIDQWCPQFHHHHPSLKKTATWIIISIITKVIVIICSVKSAPSKTQWFFTQCNESHQCCQHCSYSRQSLCDIKVVIVERQRRQVAGNLGGWKFYGIFPAQPILCYFAHYCCQESSNLILRQRSQRKQTAIKKEMWGEKKENPPTIFTETSAG